MDPDFERKLVQRAKSDPAAFGEIFDMYYERIFAYVLKRTRDADVAADISAETFHKALKNIGWFTWRGIPLGAWLYRIAGNEIKMFYRKQKYAPASLQALIESGYEPEDPELVTERRSLETMLADSEEQKQLLDTVAKLSLPEQDLIALRYFEGLKTREIAAILSKPEGTVRSMISRTIEELRQELHKGSQQKSSPSIIGSEGRSGLIAPVTEI